MRYDFPLIRAFLKVGSSVTVQVLSADVVVLVTLKYVYVGIQSRRKLVPFHQLLSVCLTAS